MPLQHFPYLGGNLQAEKVSLTALAEQLGTPFYCYSSAAIEANYRTFAGALEGLDAGIFYALKANSNQGVIATLARLGAGADVVSEGEMHRALAAGIAADRIVFAGVGKTRDEMASALKAGILQFNVESLPELEALNEVAGEMGLKAPTALRINPDVDALTLKGISTGKADNKFGIDMAEVPGIAARLSALPHISLEGLAVHIGSQMTDISPCREAFRRAAGLFRDLRDSGHPLKRLDLGGGLGIVYQGESPPDLTAYAEIVRAETADLGAELAFEPGRLMVGNAGLLVTRVIYVKQGRNRRFLVIDAAMNDLIRPMLYQAWHEFVPIREPGPGAELSPVDIVGPVCESTDTFAEQRALPPVAAGELLAICSAGAYSSVMSSTYNSRRLVPEVLVRGSQSAVVRPREAFADMIARETLPDWLLESAPPASRGVA